MKGVLKPADDRQRFLQTQALQLTSDIVKTRWELVQASNNSTPLPLMVLVIFWFAIIFTSFGLFAPANVISVVAILLCSIGVGTAIRMTTELQMPFQGLIRISGSPLAHALDVIAH